MLDISKKFDRQILHAMSLLLDLLNFLPVFTRFIYQVKHGFLVLPNKLLVLPKFLLVKPKLISYALLLKLRKSKTLILPVRVKS